MAFDPSMLTPILMEDIGSEQMFKKWADTIRSESLCKGLALRCLEFERTFVSFSLAHHAKDFDAIKEADLAVLEESIAAGLPMPIAASGLESCGTGPLAKIAGELACYPILRDGVVYGVFFIQLQSSSVDWEALFPSFFLALESRILRENAAPPEPPAVDPETARLKRRTWELDTVANATKEYAGLEGEELFKAYLLDVIGVALCDGCALFLAQNQQCSEYRVRHAKGLDPATLESLVLPENLPFVRELRAGKQPVLFEGDPAELSFREQVLFRDLRLEAAIPMVVKDSLEGFLLLGPRLNSQPYGKSVLDAATLLTGQMATALEGRRLTDLRYAFSRYLTNQLMDELLSDPTKLRLGGVRRQVTILFADIRGFTSMSENLPPEEVVAILNTYMTALTDIIFKYGGTIDKYIGDCLMAVFGAPLARDNDAERAIMAAVDMQRAIRALNAAREERGAAPVQIGIGLNTGECVSGNMGSQQRMDYTVIGDSVNVAARLEQIAKPGQILITAPLLRAVRYFVIAQKLPPVRLKGKKDEVPIYEVKELVADRVVQYLEEVVWRARECKDVSRDAVELAARCGMAADRLAQFRASSLVYDIGLVRLPKALWKSEGKLRKADREELERHAEYGAEILGRMNFFPEAQALAHSHHEHWDGSGYPDHLAGEAIPLEARIIAVVESFHAMTHERPYKSRLSVEQALAELERCAGKRYDPEVVRLFVEYARERLAA